VGRCKKDRWFKRTFGWAPAKRLMTLFLTELIPERKIIDLSFGPQEHVNPIEEGKDARVDVECTDQDGTRFVVEMQLARQADFYNRAVFNSTFAIQNQLSTGSRVFSFPPVYFIGIMNFSFHKGDKVLYRYSLQENHFHERMTDCLQYLFLELPNCTKAMTPEATVLLPSRPEGLDGEIFDLLFKSADLATFAKNERLQYFDDMHTKEDIERMIDYAREEGMEKVNLDHAKKMLAAQCSVDFISQITGLSPEAIQSLQPKK
jgi:conserved hypothetical protein (putative transposase or invertase)